ncbi:hypothetical protein LshimejAT787_0312290 [Lyophyllum shimeji]|uniref:Uncharacterized protein n=1 Tax=Lyophyllum shimeji TaxID=47721 RepID=A0A9P3UL20_LYOSH|nr:hypothetical protein LshimejAT787_0312290 [Lyophyllum shimeji]
MTGAEEVDDADGASPLLIPVPGGQTLQLDQHAQARATLPPRRTGTPRREERTVETIPGASPSRARSCVSKAYLPAHQQSWGSINPNPVAPVLLPHPGEDYHALIRRSQFDIGGLKRRPTGSATPRDLRRRTVSLSYDEPLASALSNELEHLATASVLPRLPNGVAQLAPAVADGRHPDPHDGRWDDREPVPQQAGGDRRGQFPEVEAAPAPGPCGEPEHEDFLGG